MLEWALRYIKLGWPVIPLKGKLPLTENGSKDASLNETQIRAWWKRWPDANIGLATGHAFFAVDVDIRGGGEESWDMLLSQYVAFPRTPEQLTGTGGKHILFALPDFPVKNSQGKLAPGIDVRGVGGYIVACPSVHPETKRSYSWDGLEDIENQKIAAAPPWLLVRLQEAERLGRVTPEVAKIPDQIPEGGRNDTLFRAAAGFRRKGFSADEIYKTLSIINESRCHPPLPAAEIRTIADSAARYAPDARANVFRPGASAPPAGEPLPEGEMPLGPADIEAAVDDAIANNDLLSAVKLAPYIAKLRPATQVLIKTKLRLHFKKEFPAQDFERALKDLAGGSGERAPGQVIQMPPPTDGGPPKGPISPDLLGYPLTDSGNGERIVTLFGDDIRYCIEMKKWLVWDGQRWAVDERQMATQKAKQMARLLWTQGIGREAIEKWARKSESNAGITAALQRASTEKTMPISAVELDQPIYLLNCLNGVVDLRTGKLLPHDRGYLITKMCHVTYKPDAQCPRFLKFLHWAMGANPEAEMTQRSVSLISFLQRMFGYSLTGDVSEKCVFIFYGPKGNNGKTTMLTLFRRLLSEYAAQISIDTLMSRTQDAALRADMADLRGARFAVTSEVNEGQKLSEAALKYITAGADSLIKACRKYENPMEFPATHKLIMDCNYRPNVRGADDAIWDRLKSINFNVRMEKDDPDLDKKLIEKLIAESEGILAWAVRGCVRWAEHGLGHPPEIGQATEEWREHDDPLKEFIEDSCDLGVEAWVRTAELTAAYAWWCKKNNEKYPLGRERFHERLMSKGLRKSRSRRDSDRAQLRTWEGIQVNAEVSKQMLAEGGNYSRNLPMD